MKNKYIRQLLLMSQFALVGFLVQCLTFTFLMASEADAQKNQSIENIYLTLEMKDASIQDVFNSIEGMTPFSFAYKRSVLKKDKKIDASFKKESLANLLRYISQSTGLSFKRVDETIQVNKYDQSKPAVEDNAIGKVEVGISGKITDENGEGLPGASVVVKGTSVGTTTDLDGNYKISVAEQSVLTISFVGYKTEEIAIVSQSIIDIQMEVDAEQLEEVVVIGYGSVKKKDLTGSVASVGSESIERINTASLNDALQGMAAGVQVTSSTGRPGEASTILIRGGSSISASNEPLYVIDGFPQLGGSNLDLNPQNIASIDILKDASAGAIYGARASNGVVIITTKSGARGGKLNVSYTGRRSFSSIIKQQCKCMICRLQEEVKTLNTRHQLVTSHSKVLQLDQITLESILV